MSVPSPAPGVDAFEHTHDQTLSTPSPVAAALPRFHLMSYLLGLLTSLTLVGGSVFLLRHPDPPPIQLQPPPTPSPTATASPTSTPSPIVVFVSGAVQNPGTYTLPPAARIGDALVAAGGLLAVADPTLINQAEKLYDGVQVHVPEAGASSLAEGPPVGISGLLPTATPLVAGGPSSTAGKININTATAAELDSLPGIGASKAQDIIANRPYSTVDDLDRVPGIGTATLDRLRDLVTTE